MDFVWGLVPDLANGADVRPVYREIGLDLLEHVDGIDPIVAANHVPKGLCHFGFTQPKHPNAIEVVPLLNRELPVHRCIKFEEWLGPPAPTMHTIDFFPLAHSFDWRRDSGTTASMASTYVFMAHGW